MNMATTLIFMLPEQHDPQQLAVHWWQVADGAIVAAGADETWPARAAASAELVALAPAGAVRFDVTERTADASSDRQAVTIARLKAVQTSLGEAEVLHAVGATRGHREVLTAVVDNGVMLQWLDWCRAAGVDPATIVPVGALLPVTDGWVEAQFGAQAVIAGCGAVLPGDPGLVSQLVGDADVRRLSDEDVRAALVAASSTPPLNLRTGSFARRRRIVIDRDRIRELVLLAAAIPLITLAWMIASIVALDRSTERLDGETVRIAEQALGRPVAAEQAEAELRQQRNPGTGFAPPIAALFRELQSQRGVSATALSYRRDGTLSTTLAAATVDEINRLLIALQRSAYRVTAVPRKAADGRTMVDITVRGGP